MTTLRRLGFVLGLARARLAARAERVALVALGIAAGAAVLAAVLAGSLAAEDRSVARATAAVPAGDRGVRASWGGLAGQSPAGWPGLDRIVRRALAPFGAPLRTVTIRETSFDGVLADLAATDGVAAHIRLRSGRAPRPCTPRRCEVVQLAGAGPIPRIAGLRLVRVGTGSLSSDEPFGRLINRETSRSILSSALRYHTPATAPFLLADGVAALAGARPLADIYRSYGWFVPLEPARVHPWTIDSTATRVVHARSELAARDGLFDLTAPETQLEAAQTRSRVAGRRLLLVGGQAAALLLAFAVLAAATFSRDAEAAWRRLTWFGARRWQLVAFSAAESAAIAVSGAVLGWAGGIGLGILLAHRLGSPAGDVVRHSALAGRGLATGAALTVAAALILLLSLRARPARVGGLRVSAVDVAAAGALALVLISLARGTADTASLAAGRGTGTVLILLPGLIAFVAAVACARLLAPALRALERLGRRGPVPVRLAALSLARNPGYAALAVTFLVVSLGLALFAEAYRSTLSRGQVQQAAFAVPADAIVREDMTKLVPVSAAPSNTVFLGAVPVLRLSGDVSRLQHGGFTLLGLPSSELARIRGWRSDFGRLSPSALARRIAPVHPVALRGPVLPADARELELPLRLRGSDVSLTATVETPRGSFARVDLGTTPAHVLRGAIPREARGGRVVGVSFAMTGTGLHGAPNGGTGTQPVARGTIALGALSADGRPLGADYASWTGTEGVHASGATLRYVLTPESVSRFRPSQPTDGIAVPVVASGSLASAAAADGTLPVRIEGQRLLVRVVAVVTRFPSVDGDVVVADRATVATALDTDGPGVGVTDELWLNGADPAPYRADYAVTSHRALLASLRAEPLARGSLLTLAGAAVAALVLALVGLLLGLVSDARDEGGELFDLETQGAGPAALRRHLSLRSLTVAAVGLVGGLATGAVLSALVVALVGVTADATAAQPPLRLELDWRLLALALAAYAGVAAALVAVTTRRVFRNAESGRFAEAGT